MGRLGADACVELEKAVQTASRSAEESVDAADRAGRALRIKRLEPDETAPSQPEERCAHPAMGGGHGDGYGFPGLLADGAADILAQAEDVCGRSHARQAAVKRGADFIGKRSVAAGLFNHGVVSMGVPRPLCHAVTPPDRNVRPANPASLGIRVRGWIR